MKEVEKLTTTISKQQSASGSQAKQNAAWRIREQLQAVKIQTFAPYKFWNLLTWRTVKGWSRSSQRWR
jgi:hypothetical protein